MSSKRLAAYRQRARLVGRVVFATGIAPALFFLWSSIGLPPIPGLDFGGSGAQADPGLVVRLPDTPHPQARVDALRAPATAAQARRPRNQHPGRTSHSSKPAPAPTAIAPAVPRTPDAAATTEVRAPAVAAQPVLAPAPTPAPVPTPAVEPPVVSVPPVPITPPVVLPALPSLPAVQTPPVPIPPVVLPLPATPALPVLPPINGVVVP